MMFGNMGRKERKKEKKERKKNIRVDFMTYFRSRRVEVILCSGKVIARRRKTNASDQDCPTEKITISEPQNPLIDGF